MERELVSLIPLEGSLLGTVKVGDLVIIQRQERTTARGIPLVGRPTSFLVEKIFGLVRPGNGEAYKLPAPSALELFVGENLETEVLCRVPIDRGENGEFVFVIPPNGKERLKLIRGENREEVLRKARENHRATEGALFQRVDL